MSPFFPLADGYRVAIDSDSRAVSLTVHDASGAAQVSLDIVITAEGPRIRARAVSVELEAERDITARCEHFRVEARGDIALLAAGTLQERAARVHVEAAKGAVRIRANDDVQLLGEQVLLNCERDPPLPGWVPLGPGQGPEALPLEAVSGDAELATLLATPRALKHD